MKIISPTVYPHSHGLTFEDLDTFMFEFVIFCRTYNYTSHDQKLNLFPSTLKDATFVALWVYLGITSLHGLKCNKPLTTSTWTTVGPNKPKKKSLE